MASLRILLIALKALLLWLLLAVVFVVAASFTGGFKAYCPTSSLLAGLIAVYIVIIILALLTGGAKD